MRIVVTFEGFENVVEAVKNAFSSGEFAELTTLPAPVAPPVALVAQAAPLPVAPPVAPPVAQAAPVAPPVALVAQAAPLPVAPPVGDLDVNGMPWDARIHARTKTKKADMSWRTKRGVPAEEVARVTAEIMGAPVPLAPPVGTPVAQAAPVAPVVDMSFEGLMALAESKGLQFADMDQIAKRHGVVSCVLLQQQPALIPPIYAEVQAQIHGQ